MSHSFRQCGDEEGGIGGGGEGGGRGEGGVGGGEGGQKRGRRERKLEVREEKEVVEFMLEVGVEGRGAWGVREMKRGAGLRGLGRSKGEWGEGEESPTSNLRGTVTPHIQYILHICIHLWKKV